MKNATITDQTSSSYSFFCTSSGVCETKPAPRESADWISLYNRQPRLALHVHLSNNLNMSTYSFDSLSDTNILPTVAKHSLYVRKQHNRTTCRDVYHPARRQLVLKRTSANRFYSSIPPFQPFIGRRCMCSTGGAPHQTTREIDEPRLFLPIDHSK